MITLYAEQITQRLKVKATAFNHYRKYRKEINEFIYKEEDTEYGDTHIFTCSRDYLSADFEKAFLVHFPFEGQKYGLDAKRYFDALGFDVRAGTLSDDTAFACYQENWFNKNSARLDTKQIITCLVKGALAFHIYSKTLKAFPPHY